jgi:hypothetical protein
MGRREVSHIVLMLLRGETMNKPLDPRPQLVADAGPLRVTTVRLPQKLIGDGRLINLPVFGADSIRTRSASSWALPAIFHTHVAKVGAMTRLEIGSGCHGQTV